MAEDIKTVAAVEDTGSPDPKCTGFHLYGGKDLQKFKDLHWYQNVTRYLA